MSFIATLSFCDHIHTLLTFKQCVIILQWKSMAASITVCLVVMKLCRMVENHESKWLFDCLAPSLLLAAIFLCLFSDDLLSLRLVVEWFWGLCIREYHKVSLRFVQKKWFLLTLCMHVIFCVVLTDLDSCPRIIMLMTHHCPMMSLLSSVLCTLSPRWCQRGWADQIQTFVCFYMHT